MQRRALLRFLGGAVTLPALAGLSPDRLLALGRATHARADAARRLPEATSELIAALADRILPASDTPGATDVGVPAFIELIMADWMTEREQADCMTGLAQIDRRAIDTYSTPFLSLSAEQQVALMTRLDSARGAPDSAEGSFSTIKGLSVYGYFTSEPVVTRVLKTPMIPGHYDGAAPLHSH